MQEQNSNQSVKRYIRRGLNDIRAGRFAEAEDVLGLALDEQPRLAQLWLLRGMARAHLGRRNEAFHDAQRAVSLSANDPGLLHQAARLLHSVGRPMDSLQCLERAAEHMPNDEALYKRLFDAYMKLGWYKEALSAMRTAIEQAPDKSKLVVQAARTLFHNLGDPEAAVDILERHFQPGTGNPEVWLLMAEALGALGRFSDGLTAAVAALHIGPPTVETYLAVAGRQVALGDPSAALRNTQHALELSPDSVNSLFAHAELLLWCGDDSQASLEVERILRLEPNHFGAHALQGALHVRAGRQEEAEKALEKVLLQDPNDPTALAWRGELRRAQGRFSEAVVDIDMALMVLPEYSVILEVTRLLTVMTGQRLIGLMDRDAYRELVTIFAPVLADPSKAMQCNGRVAQVRALLEEAVAAFRGNRSAHATWVDAQDSDGQLRGLPLSKVQVHSRYASRLIQEMVRTRDRDDLMERFDALTATHPGEPIIHCYKGETLFWLGDYEASAVAFDRALAITKKVRWGYAGKCALAVMAKDYEGCIKWAVIGAKAFPPPGRTLYAYRGEAYRRLGRLDEALADTRKMLGITPGRIASWINLALIEWEAGDASSLAPMYTRLCGRAPGLVWDAEQEVGVINEESLEPEAIVRLFEHMLFMMRGNRCSDFVTYFTAKGQLRFVPATENPVSNDNNYT